MFALLANSVIWLGLAWWLFPGLIPYIIGLVLLIAICFVIIGVGFWETNSSNSETDFKITVGDDTFSGKIKKDE
jgi:ABC-type uncharacterized transport system permease subunit